MNLKQHYESYSASLKKDVLPGFLDFTKNSKTADPEVFPTVYDYIHDIRGKIQNSIDSNDEEAYKRFLLNHQEAFVAILKEMVTIALKEQTILDLMHYKSMSYYKFSNYMITLDNCIWVPRYGMHPVTSTPTFDSDEVKLVLNMKSQSQAQRIIAKKHAGLCKVVDWDKNGPIFKNLNEVSTESYVWDWVWRFPW